MTRTQEDHRHRILSDFFGLDDQRHADLVQSMQPVELRGGQWLFEQGDPGDSLYLLARGRLEAWHQSGAAPAVLLNEISAGEAVGEVGLLTEAPRSAGVRARRDSLLFRVDRSTLEKLAQNHPDLVMQIMASVARRLAQNTHNRHTRPAPRTLALVVLDPDPGLEQYTERLACDLGAAGPAQVLTPERLVELGAPEVSGLDHEGPGTALKQWIAAQEEQHQQLVFLVRPDQTRWAEFALRQADLVVRLVASDADPQPRPVESMLAESRSEPKGAESVLVLWHRPGAGPITGSHRWLDVRAHTRLLHVRADVANDHARLVRILTGKAIGLVLSGGAVRGLAHLGVFKAMEELGVPVDWVGGTSMGAVIGAAIATGWQSDHAISESYVAFVKGRPLTDYTLPLISLMRGRRMRRLTQRQFPGGIEDLPIPFFAISSNLNTGDTNVHERGSLWRALCASASLPGLFPPAVHRQELTIDGAITNNLPVDIMQQRRVGQVIAVSLGDSTQRKVGFADAPSPWAVLFGKVWPFGRRARVPGVASMMLKAIELGSRKRVEELSERADLLLRPPVQRFNMIDVKQFQALVEVGYESSLTDLQSWLALQPK